MLLGTMVPIPKLMGTNKSDNYCAITISSLFGKLLDIMILSRHRDHLSTSNLNLASKKDALSDTCSLQFKKLLIIIVNMAPMSSARCHQGLGQIGILYPVQTVDFKKHMACYNKVIIIYVYISVINSLMECK